MTSRDRDILTSVPSTGHSPKTLRPSVHAIQLHETLPAWLMSLSFKIHVPSVAPDLLKDILAQITLMTSSGLSWVKQSRT